MKLNYRRESRPMNIPYHNDKAREAAEVKNQKNTAETFVLARLILDNAAKEIAEKYGLK